MGTVKSQRLRPPFWAIYPVIAVILGWTSFHGRPLDVSFAAEFQQGIWENFWDPGSIDTAESSLVRVHASRILFPSLMQIPQLVGISVEHAFALLRLTSIAVVLLLFHPFLMQWLDERSAFAGTLFLAATLPLTFNNYFEIPTDFLEITIFTIGVWAMHLRRWPLFYVVIAVGTLNRETTAVLPFLMLFQLFDRTSTEWLKQVFIGGLCWLIPIVSLRLWTVGSLSSPHSDSLAHNIPGLMELVGNPHPYNNFLFWLYLFGGFWVIPYLGWARQPPFFRRLLLAIPVIVAVYAFGGGYFDEPRELVNLYPVLVPAALLALFPAGVARPRPRAPSPVGGPE